MTERRRASIRRPLLPQWHAWLRAAAFVLVLNTLLVAVLAFQFLPSAYQLKEGEVSRQNIKSPQRVTYVSQLKTQEERDRAAAAVPDQYTRDAALSTAMQQQLAEALQRVGEIRRDTATAEQKRANLEKLVTLGLTTAVTNDILSLDEESWRSTAAEATRIVSFVLSNSVSAAQAAESRSQLPNLVTPELSARQATVAAALARDFIRTNMMVDAEATERARRAAKDVVPPVRLTIEEGEMILREGDVVKPADLEKLQAAGLNTTTLKWTEFASIFLLSIALSLLLGLYVALFHPEVLLNERRALLLISLIVVATLSVHLVIPGHPYFAYVIPVAAISMLVAALLDPQLAMASTLVLAPLFATIGGHSLELATLALGGGFVGLIGTARMERLNRLILTGLGIAGVNFVILLAFQIRGGEITLSHAGTLAALSLINGVLCAIFALGGLFLLGHLFGITTALGLLELAHPSQPLFRRLLTDAPGTYHHSVIVANLAERAANEVGADAMLSRVGAYYHDIGKVVHPYRFVENQMDGVNIHNELAPHVSAQFVISHVKDGLALAQRHALPSKVRDIIEQHHGTNWASFFYHQACQNPEEEPDAATFRYPGPRPQTAESAIVMLADGVEATVRSCQDHSPERIEQLVRKTIDDRLADGQLNECDLTLRDLEKIRGAFCTVLQGIFHPRIEYPDTQRPASPVRLFGRGREEQRARTRGGNG